MQTPDYYQQSSKDRYGRHWGIGMGMGHFPPSLSKGINNFRPNFIGVEGATST